MASTNTKTILTDLKSLAIKYSDGTKGTGLSTIKTFKRGVLGPNTIFPSMTFSPISESIIGGYNGKYKLEHRIDTEIFTKSGRQKDAKEKCMELSRTWQNVFRDSSNTDNYQLKDGSGNQTIYNFQIGQPEDSVYDLDEGETQLIRCMIPMGLRSFTDFPSGRIDSDFDTETAGIYDVSEQIHTKLKADSDLNYVKFTFGHHQPPFTVGNGVVVSVVDSTENTEKFPTSHHEQERNINILVWSKTSPFERNLDINLETVDHIRDLVFTYPRWSGKGYRSRINGTTFGIDEDRLLYQSIIDFRVYTREKFV